jgi:O-antigen/teichoic acid export membrane protein
VSESSAPLISSESVRPSAPGVEVGRRANGWLRAAGAATPAASRLMPVAYGMADQALAVGGVFLVNIALARTQTKEEYGMFALSYSVFAFLTGLHNAAILEPYTVYGSGRHRTRSPEYFRLMARSHAMVCLLLTGGLLAACGVFRLAAPPLASRALAGLGLTIGLLLTGSFLRRVFYVQGQAECAAGTSLVFFLVVTGSLWAATQARLLSSFSAFVILGLAWAAGGAALAKKLPRGNPALSFLDQEPGYWREHWKYARWAFASAVAILMATQGYYWVVAEILTVKEVAELRAMLILTAPVDQFYIALSYLVLPAMASHFAARRMRKFFSLGGRLGLLTICLTACFALGLRLWGKPVMHFLYAGKFDSIASLLFPLALLPLLMGIGNTFNDALKAAEKPRLVFYGYLAGGAATFLVGIPMVMHYGLRGAVYGLLTSASAYTIALAAGFGFAASRAAFRPGERE